MEKIVLVTNHLTPYRKSFYDAFYLACKEKNIDFSVLLMTKREPNRNWDYKTLLKETKYAYLMKGKRFSKPFHSYYNSEVISKLKEIKPDIVLMAGSYMYYTNWLVLLKKKKLNYPVLYWNEAHFNEKRSYNNFTLGVREFIRKRVFPKFDGFWYSGEMSKQLINYYSKENAKLYFLPNFIDNKTYHEDSKKSEVEINDIKNKLKIPLDNKIAIIPARLSKVKGIDIFIDLLTKIDKEHSKRLTILIPGTGEYEDVIQNKINSSGLDIRLLGFVKQDVMIELYSIVNLFMLPSISDPNPLTCIEALWCGLPLFISSHVGNYPEVVEEGLNGYVFKYNEEEDAIKKLDTILSADDNWSDVAKEKSFEIANKYYNPDVIIKKVINQMKHDFIN